MCTTRPHHLHNSACFTNVSGSVITATTSSWMLSRMAPISASKLSTSGGAGGGEPVLVGGAWATFAVYDVIIASCASSRMRWAAAASSERFSAYATRTNTGCTWGRGAHRRARDQSGCHGSVGPGVHVWVTSAVRIVLHCALLFCAGENLWHRNSTHSNTVHIAKRYQQKHGTWYAQKARQLHPLCV